MLLHRYSSFIIGVHLYKLTPNERFLSTMRTIGGQVMVEKYERLILFQRDEKKLVDVFILLLMMFIF